MPPKRSKSSQPQPPPSQPTRATTVKHLRLPSHPRDVPEYTAFWTRHRGHLLVLLVTEALMVAQHFIFRRLLISRYLPLQNSKFRGPLEAVAVMGSPLFVDVCISTTKTLVALAITCAPVSIRSRIPVLFYIVVCRLINAADGVYLCMLQLYLVRLVEDYNDYPWFTGKNAPSQPARVPVFSLLNVAGPYLASGFVLTRALLFFVSQCYVGFSKSVPIGCTMDMIVSAECVFKLLLFFNSLLSGTPYISSGWGFMIPIFVITLESWYHTRVQKRKLQERQALWFFTNVEFCQSRLPTALTMVWFATGLRKAASSLRE